MKTEEELIQHVGDDYAARHRAGFDDAVTRVCALCESPIERVMIAALYSEFKSAPGYLTCHWSIISARLPDDAGTFDDIFAYPQAMIGQYRVDLAVIARWNGRAAKFVVECDGHDFHERTKEQAQRDKRRDRYLQGMGYRVLRFTGSEIWADPIKCAAEVRYAIDDAVVEIAGDA